MPGDANGFKFQKVFGDASFVAAGMLEIPVGGEKPSKPTKDNTYVRPPRRSPFCSRCLVGLTPSPSPFLFLPQLFYVIEGSVTVKVHRTSFTMAPGGQFMVPRGSSTARLLPSPCRSRVSSLTFPLTLPLTFFSLSPLPSRMQATNTPSTPSPAAPPSSSSRKRGRWPLMRRTSHPPLLLPPPKPRRPGRAEQQRRAREGSVLVHISPLHLFRRVRSFLSLVPPSPMFLSLGSSFYPLLFLSF